MVQSFLAPYGRHLGHLGEGLECVELELENAGEGQGLGPKFWGLQMQVEGARGKCSSRVVAQSLFFCLCILIKIRGQHGTWIIEGTCSSGETLLRIAIGQLAAIHINLLCLPTSTQ